MKQTRIREARQTDLSGLTMLVRQEAEFAQGLAAYYQLQPDFDWVSLARKKLQHRDRVIFVAEKGAELAGFIEARIVRYSSTKAIHPWLNRLMRKNRAGKGIPIKPMLVGAIESCFVLESCRHGGTGRALVETSLGWFAGRNVNRVELGVLAAKDGARSFWEQLGFSTFRLMMYRQID